MARKVCCLGIHIFSCEWTVYKSYLGYPGSPNPGKAEGAAAAVLNDAANRAFFAYKNCNFQKKMIKTDSEGAEILQ